ncbi:PREDICTED: uncharacterized protein LOC109184591 [Ipomoea nil]|uniref:uncharacterized protein LOC109184591 n=1 Tax=Ipomoea nil TaxID=35883 RepID=UPI000901AD86|nr:PREDICTED: uncharacterized protein LOC109184591 [Ipomoea nil]
MIGAGWFKGLCLGYLGFPWPFYIVCPQHHRTLHAPLCLSDFVFIFLLRDFSLRTRKARNADNSHSSYSPSLNLGFRFSQSHRVGDMARLPLRQKMRLQAVVLILRIRIMESMFNMLMFLAMISFGFA